MRRIALDSSSSQSPSSIHPLIQTLCSFVSARISKHIKVFNTKKNSHLYAVIFSMDYFSIVRSMKIKNLIYLGVTMFLKTQRKLNHIFWLIQHSAFATIISKKNADPFVFCASTSMVIKSELETTCCPKRVWLNMI